MAISKIIHQVWEGRTEPAMPLRLQILARTWQEQNPTWEYHLWNGEEMDDLVSTYFPEYMPMYKSFPYNVQRWDTIRYMILFLQGGVYTDLDSECFRPLDPLVEDQTMCFGEEPPAHNVYPQLDRLIGNALMASEAGCQGWLKVLEEIGEATRRGYPDQTVMHTTGPLMISRIFPLLKEMEEAQYLPYQKVAPVSKVEMSRYILEGKVDFFNDKIKDAFCAHYFFGSWIKSYSIYI